MKTPNSKPILFSAPMVNAIIAGNKKQTRRLMPSWCNEFCSAEIVRDPELCDFKATELKPKQHYGLFACFDKGEEHLKCHYQIGDMLWVKETFTISNWIEHIKSVAVIYEDKAERFVKLTDDEWSKFEKWINKTGRKSSLFMFKSISRLNLLITDVRSERLQEITYEDAIAEGIELIDDGNSFGYKLYGEHSIGDMLGRRAVTGTEIESYQTLWEKINGKGSWELNPFVWVYDFLLLNK